MSVLGTKYLNLCKSCYLNNIRPANSESIQTRVYAELVEIAQSYFKESRIEDFSKFFQEYQYCVNLWTAHLVIEFGNPNDDLISKALEIIKRYSHTELNIALAKEETIWLKRYKQV